MKKIIICFGFIIYVIMIFESHRILTTMRFFPTEKNASVREGTAYPSTRQKEN